MLQEVPSYTLAADTWGICCTLLQVRRGRKPWWWLPPLPLQQPQPEAQSPGDKPAAAPKPRYDPRMCFATLLEEGCPYLTPDQHCTPLTAQELELLQAGLVVDPGQRPLLGQLQAMCRGYFDQVADEAEG